jgi:hypothetical protein
VVVVRNIRSVVGIDYDEINSQKTNKVKREIEKKNNFNQT